jgi:hypothetical protein
MRRILSTARIGVPDDVELVEGDARVGQVLGAAPDERWRHVDADGRDLLRRAVTALQLGCQLGDRVGAAALRHGDHASLSGVCGERDVIMPASPRRLVDGQLAHRGQVRLRQGELHVALAERGDTVTAHAHQARRRGKGHLLAQQQHQGFEQQREARELAGPRRIDLADAAIGQLYPGDTHFQEALVLEEVQVPVTLGDGVVNRMLALHASQREAAAGDEVHPDGERLGRQIEVRARHLPRRRDPQGSLKQLVSHTRSRTCSGPAYPLEIEKRRI